eukprot:TRINITY_DN2336_c0_g1_i1.p1 TRINITY_DN2336_c0_g1~~TRINITY_DN2336_c0_g1_i1.p1  ORF type:complete len:320 (+),score=63.06 TRINITY_DN2336_c0_g1_i1:176-1135(+)
MALATDAYLESSDRPLLHAAFKSATLHRDRLAQEILFNALLRNYIQNKLYDQGRKFFHSTSLQQPFVSSNQAARYSFYAGVIEVVTLNYSDAFEHFTAAQRRAPDRAVGFRVLVVKFHAVTQLLLGDVPPRRTFVAPQTAALLRPYLEVTSAVRFGNLQTFQRVLRQHEHVFERDGTLPLIHRVHHNVLKTGLRRAVSAYSRISLASLAQKLALGDATDAAYVVAKAVADGIVDATIDPDVVGGAVIPRRESARFATATAAASMRRRIEYLVALRHELQRAMKFPPETDDRDADATGGHEPGDSELDLDLGSEGDDMDF